MRHRRVAKHGSESLEEVERDCRRTQIATFREREERGNAILNLRGNGALLVQFVGRLGPGLYRFGSELRVRPVRRRKAGPQLLVRRGTGDHGTVGWCVRPGQVPGEMLQQHRVRPGAGGLPDGRAAAVHARQVPGQRQGRLRLDAEYTVQGLPQDVEQQREDPGGRGGGGRQQAARRSVGQVVSAEGEQRVEQQ